MSGDEYLHSPELVRSSLGSVVYAIYRLVKGQTRWSAANVLFKILKKLEKGPGRSATMRMILDRHHQVRVGAYSYGDCFIVGAFPPQVDVGRFVSIAPGVRVYNQNHPIDFVSMHPFFYEAGFGLVKENPMPRHTLVIGHDSWLGRNATITPGCKRIGIGAVVGAGAVVTKDVDDYAIVGGNPAKLIRYRFDEPTRASLLASKWWEKSIDEIRQHVGTMTTSVNGEVLNHPLLRGDAAVPVEAR